MKLRLGKVLIETDHIEQVIDNTYENIENVLIIFVSQEKLHVACKGSPISLATWNGTAESLIQAIEGHDRLVIRESK